MSRAFGNRMLKQFVVAEPEIQVNFDFVTLSIAKLSTYAILLLSLMLLWSNRILGKSDINDLLTSFMVEYLTKKNNLLPVQFWISQIPLG